MSAKVRIRIEELETQDSCEVEVVDNDWWNPLEANDHWRMISGSLPGVTARRGSWAKFSTMMNLHSLARLSSFPAAPRRGDVGDGLLQGSGAGGSGVVSWEVV